MSPEQARGLPIHKLTQATDVYGLGSTLYELASGRLPIPVRDGAAAPWQDIIDQKAEGITPERPPEIPRRLWRIIRRAMHAEPTKRYPTALALAEDLERYLARYSTSADTILDRAWIWSKRPHVGLVAVNVILVACSIVLMGQVAKDGQRKRELDEQMASISETTQHNTYFLMRDMNAALKLTSSRMAMVDAHVHDLETQVPRCQGDLDQKKSQLTNLNRTLAMCRNQHIDATQTLMTKEDETRQTAIDADLDAARRDAAGWREMAHAFMFSNQMAPLTAEQACRQVFGTELDP